MPRPPEHISDFFTDTPDRIIGTETEYSLQLRHLVKLRYVNALKPYMLLPPSFTANRTWLSDGSKLYIDFIDLPDDAPDTAHVSSDGILEFATAECATAQDAMLHEKAGEHLAYQIASETVTASSNRYPIFKRTAFAQVINEDDEIIMEAGSIGHHENYLTDVFTTERDDKKPRAELLSYLATRAAWAGAGIVTERGYHTTQKIDGTLYSQHGTDLVTHGSKMPLRVHWDDRGTPTIEVRTGDGNMSAWAIRTKLAMTSLVLRLIEHETFPETALVSDSHLQRLANHGSRRPGRRVRLGSFEGTAISHQEQIAQAALELAVRHDVPKDELTAALDVLKTCTDMREWCKDPDALELLVDRVDWAAKLAYIQRRTGAATGGITTRNLGAVVADLQWEALGPDGPSTKHYAKYGNVVTDSQAVAALLTPPNTRAKTRVQTIEDFRDNGLVGVDWSTFSFNDDKKNFKLTDPYLRD